MVLKELKCWIKISKRTLLQVYYLYQTPWQSYKQRLENFYLFYCAEWHKDIEHWVITLIDNADTLKELRRKELYGMYRLKPYALYGLNERDVYEAF